MMSATLPSTPATWTVAAVVPEAVHDRAAALPVTGLCTDSRRATPGCLFFAMPGLRVHGADFVEEAVARGASAVVAESPVWTPPSVPLIPVENVRTALSKAASIYHQRPERGLELVGLCGTGGKTVVLHLLHALLAARSVEPVAALGTVSYRIGRRSLPSNRTTPEPCELFGLLAQAREQGCRRVLMELSSHGIDQGRIQGLPFAVAALLNLSPEHLDYHGSMEHYYRTVRQVFTRRFAERPERAVVHSGDVYGRRLLQELPSGSPVVTFAADDLEADFHADAVELTLKSSRFTVQGPGGCCTVETPLLGDFMVHNVLAAAAVLHALGEDWQLALGGLAHCAPVPGRLEPVQAGQAFPVLVDYAHTPASYARVLTLLRRLTPGRLHVVFGCGGDRDPRTRPEITRIVAGAADQLWITADNPRSEAVTTIFGDMRPGLPSGASAVFIEDRRIAIHRALAEARPGDTVLIAGRGHEAYQEFADTVTPFDDRAVARNWLREHLSEHA